MLTISLAARDEPGPLTIVGTQVSIRIEKLAKPSGTQVSSGFRDQFRDFRPAYHLDPMPQRVAKARYPSGQVLTGEPSWGSETYLGPGDL